MKILIFGKNGQLGSSLMQLLRPGHQVQGYDRDDFDLRQSAKIHSVVQTMQPDWVINASAYTAVDRAEQEAELADQINHLAPAEMAKACTKLGCGFLHFSTDYVFDGCATRPYLEEDSPNPQSVYGKTKLAGDQAVLKIYPQAIILRTAWVYAREGGNFVNTMLRLAGEHAQLNVVDDQFGSPTLALDLAQASVLIIEKTPLDSLSTVAGVYHATGSGTTSWFGFAQQIFALKGITIELNPIPSEQYPTPAPRPHYSVLSNDKLQQVFGIRLADWQESLAKTLTAKS